MGSERLSGRQLSVAALVAGLSWAGVLAGEMDWRWVLLFSPGIILLWQLLVKKGEKGLLRGWSGRVLQICFCGWSALLMARVLHRAAERMVRVNGAEGAGVWIVLLLALPLLAVGWGRSAPFFRMAEILWLAVPVLLAALVLAAVPGVEWRWLAGPMGDWRKSAAGTVLTLSPLLFTLPYIYKVEQRPKTGWQMGVAAVTAVLAALTAGILSPAAAGRIPASLFVAAGALEQSVRGDGLVSALWLLPDLTLVGLLARGWGGRFGPLCATGLAVLLAAAGISPLFSEEILALGTVILAAAVLVLPAGTGRVVVSFW